MPSAFNKDRFQIRILEDAGEMYLVEALQRLVWPGNDMDVVPTHLLVTAAHNGGLVIGAFDLESQPDLINSPLAPGNGSPPLVGFVFGFPGLQEEGGILKVKHCSHMLGVHPTYRDQGIGFVLKRAQWQMVRHLGIQRITWTYDPLLSRNAHLNIARLGTVCNTYLRQVYGDMRDGLNVGLPSDRFQVDWWVDSQRVATRISHTPRPKLDLAHFLAADAALLNPTKIGDDNLPIPDTVSESRIAQLIPNQNLCLVEIPADFLALKAQNQELGYAWRMHSRLIFETLFTHGFLVTDFVYLPGTHPRSFYILSHGESTL